MFNTLALVDEWASSNTAQTLGLYIVHHDKEVAWPYVESNSGQIFLSVSVLRVIWPTTRFHLPLLDSPERQLLLKQRTAEIPRRMEMACAVIVQNDTKDFWISVEEKFLFSITVKVTAC